MRVYFISKAAIFILRRIPNAGVLTVKQLTCPGPFSGPRGKKR